jgi:hypothetical protein
MMTVIRRLRRSEQLIECFEFPEFHDKKENIYET